MHTTLNKNTRFFARAITRVLILISLFACQSAIAAVDLAHATDLRDLGKYSHFIFDGHDEFSFETLPPANDPRWHRPQKHIISQGYSKEVLWIRLPLINRAHNRDWMLEIGYPIIDRIDVYIDYADKVESYHLGDRLKFSERPIHYRNMVVPFTLDNNQSAVITLRVSTGSSLKVPLKVWSEHDFYQYQQTSLLFYGTFFGFMLVMIAYNLILYFFVNEFRYLFYVTFATAFVVFQAALSGLGYQFFWSNQITFNEHVLPTSLGVTLVFETLFVSTFLNLAKDAPRIARFLKWITWILAGLSVAALFLNNRDAIRPLIAMGIVLNLLFFFLGVQRWRDGNRAARIFTIAWSFPVFSGVLVGLVAFGLVEHTSFSEYSMAVSMVLAVVLLSFALGESFAQQREERIQAREEAHRLSIEMQKEREINRKISALNEEISDARDESEKRRQVVSDLLNNSSQGFIAFGNNLLVEPDFSRACLNFFGSSPEGKQVTELLYPPEDEGGRTFFKHAISEVLVEDDEFRRDMMLSLLPTQFQVEDHCLEAEYKPLRGARVMMVLTDISNEIKLREQVEQEHRRLTMIVSAVTDQRDVTETIASFRRFLIQACKGYEMSGEELYRKVHTFKGLFNQFSFVALPSALHEVEKQLSQCTDKSNIPFNTLWQAFDTDMDVIVERLGANFNENQGFVQVSGQTLKELNVLIHQYLADCEHAQHQHALQCLAAKVALLDKVELKEMFTPLLRGTYSLAREQGKSVHVAFDGENVMLTRKHYEDFVNSLVHVFRNAVDHGIELPTERTAKGKQETGTITCHYEISGPSLVIQISDDGQGIDCDLLREQLRQVRGLDEHSVAALSEDQLLQCIFDDGMTTRDEVTEVSGRGVGLAATRNEVEKLGGSITVSSTPEKGMCITIRLPWLLDNTAKLHTETEQSKDSTLVLLDVLKQHTYAYLANEGELEDIRLAPNQTDMAAISLNESSVYVRIEAPYEVWVVFYFEQSLLSFLAQTFLDQTES
ncbi:MAG: 7TM diverse intracellular signaling domain-containing protein, partial [Oleiphilaceae bacterium]|nr:7TM diverse intracellular signaling domain-containing protein [Oleiphilaceae bacterium]